MIRTINKDDVRSVALDMIKEATDSMWGLYEKETGLETVHYIGGIVDMTKAVCKEIDKKATETEINK